MKAGFYESDITPFYNTRSATAHDYGLKQGVNTPFSFSAGVFADNVRKKDLPRRCINIKKSILLPINLNQRRPGRRCAAQTAINYSEVFYVFRFRSA